MLNTFRDSEIFNERLEYKHYVVVTLRTQKTLKEDWKVFYNICNLNNTINFCNIIEKF